MADLDLWDPTMPSPFDREALEAESRSKDRQRKTLFDIRERLQRAMIVGDRFNCVESTATNVHDFEPVSNATHRVLGDARTDVLYASNYATSLLLSRQFEGISRKDIIIQESDERLALTQSVHALLMLRIQSEAAANLRLARIQVEASEHRERDLKALLLNRMTELENSCRRRTEVAADECFSILARDSGRAFQLASVGHAVAQRNWVAQEEERARSNLAVECEQQLSRLFSNELSRGQAIRHKELLHRKVPIPATELIDGDLPDSSRFAQGARTGTHTNENVEDYAPESELIPLTAAPNGFAESDTSSTIADNPSSFKPYWGWMLKSTGILMTWQRRFFVFTTRGKLKCSVGDNGPWHVIFSANNIIRVEVDSYHDTNGGAAPPTSQYHQYGFFVDLYDPTSVARPKRMRFCCFSRKELNAWLTVLRRATDIIFALEESGSIARSPARRRLDLSDERTRLAIKNLSANFADGVEHVTAAPTYRRRQQLEEELQAIELRRSEERARGQKTHSSPQLRPISEAFGLPPGM